MADRDYDKEPVEVTFTVKLYVYGPVKEEKLKQICSDTELQEDMLMLLTENIPHGTGMDDITYTIK